MLVEILSVDEVPLDVLDKATRAHLVDERIGSTRMGMMLITLKPNAPPTVPYHFHKNKECVFFILEGKAKVKVDDQEYIVSENTAILIGPTEKHEISNIGGTDLRIIEVYSPLPLREDNFIVDAK